MSTERMSEEERERRMRRAQERRENGNRRRKKMLLVWRIALLVAVLVFVIALWQLSSILLGYYRGNASYNELLEHMSEETVEIPAVESEEETIPVTGTEGAGEEEEEETESAAVTPTYSYTLTVPDFSYLTGVNRDVTAWIQIPGTIINFPVVQGADNVYYLTHTFAGQSISNGAIFMEAAISDGFSDKNVILYGHNMKSGAMFGGLSQYSSKSYWSQHPYVYITTSDGVRHIYQIFSVYQLAAEDAVYYFGFSENDTYESYLAYLKSLSLYDTGVTVSRVDQIVTLSTCAKNSTQRFVVHAKKIS